MIWIDDSVTGRQEPSHGGHWLKSTFYFCTFWVLGMGKILRMSKPQFLLCKLENVIIIMDSLLLLFGQNNHPGHGILLMKVLEFQNTTVLWGQFHVHFWGLAEKSLLEKEILHFLKMHNLKFILFINIFVTLLTKTTSQQTKRTNSITVTISPIILREDFIYCFT